MATLSTPTYGFPYPDGSERVMDGDNAIGALATAIENRLKALAALIQLHAASTADLVLTNAIQDCAGAAITYTPAIPERVLIVAFFDFQISATDPGIVNGWLYQGAGQVGYPARYYAGPTGTGRATVGLSHLVSVAAGSPVTFKLSAIKTNAAGTVSALQGGTRLSLLRVAQ